MVCYLTMVHWTTSILVLVLLFTVKGSRVAVAKVQFTQSHYTVKEKETICVDVVNDLPTSERFTVSFSYSVVLLGGAGIGRPTETRTSSVFFLANRNSSVACIIDRVVNDSPCEREITGTIRLINSTKVAIGTQASATITIQDDDVISATFGKSMFTITEGFGSMDLFPFVNNSSPSMPQLQLLIVSSNHMNDMVEQSIFFTGSVLTSPQQRQPLQNLIMDDNVALEETEYITLELAMAENPQCLVNFLPFNTTTIKVTDDDDVRIQLKMMQEITREGEDYRVCVTMSNMIARELRININIHTGTADLVDIGQDSMTITIVLQPFDYDRKECSDIPIIQDHIIESEESFSISLSLGEELPRELMRHLTIDSPNFTIKIQDTSTCYGHEVGPTVTDSTLYVRTGRTLCFTCRTCSPSNMIWNVVSSEGNMWSGLTGERLQSSQNLIDQGMIFSNGTLLITNSSSLFSKKVPGIISYAEKNMANSSRKYNILLGDAAVIIDLNISIEGLHIYKIICKYRGIPEPRMVWLINKTPVKEDQNIRTMEADNHFQSILTIRNITSVKYTCIVSNPFGEDYSEGSVHQRNKAPIINSSQNLCAMYLINLAVFLFSQI